MGKESKREWINVYLYWFTLLYCRNKCNTINQLCSVESCPKASDMEPRNKVISGTVWAPWSLLFSRSVVSDSLRLHGCSTPALPVLWYLPEFAQLISSELVMPTNHLILCCPLLLLPSIFSSIRASELAVHIRWPKYWSFSFRISPSNEYSGLTSFRLDWFDLLAVKGLSRVFSSPGKHQLEGINSWALGLLQSNPHIHMWLLEKPLCNHCQKLCPHPLLSSPADLTQN